MKTMELRRRKPPDRRDPAGCGNPRNPHHGVTKVPDAEKEQQFRTAEELIPLVYEDLRRLAAWRLAREPAPMTQEATALVHRAYLRLSPGERKWDGRAHFICAAARTMCRILVEEARRKAAAIHGGHLRQTRFFDDCIASPTRRDREFLEIHEILDRLARFKPRKARVVKLRYFQGMTIKEVADALGIAEPTVKRDWNFARAWLRRELTREAEARTLSCGGIESSSYRTPARKREAMTPKLGTRGLALPGAA